MKIHHKNMKQVSQDMQQWVQSNLAHFGVYECSYFYFDVVQGVRMPMPMYYDWYCQYMEKNLDLFVAERLKNASNYWSNSNHFYSNYENFIQKRSFYKLDLVNKLTDGYEMLSVGCDRVFSSYEYAQLQSIFRQLSYKAACIRKEKPNIMVEIRPLESVKALHQENSITSTNDNTFYAKSSFDGVTLTAKEQQYIEYIMFNLTHKEIAYKHQCSEMAVRKVIMNIKRKLGNINMPTSQMCYKLRDCGALSVCARSFHHA